jgi:hypothetical protein
MSELRTLVTPAGQTFQSKRFDLSSLFDTSVPIWRMHDRNQVISIMICQPEDGMISGAVLIERHDPQEGVYQVHPRVTWFQAKEEAVAALARVTVQELAELLGIPIERGQGPVIPYRPPISRSETVHCWPASLAKGFAVLEAWWSFGEINSSFLEIYDSVHGFIADVFTEGPPMAKQFWTEDVSLIFPLLGSSLAAGPQVAFWDTFIADPELATMLIALGR